MLQDFSDLREMTKQPANAPTGFNPLHQPEGVSANKPDNAFNQTSAAYPVHQPAQSTESKTFCSTENKPGEPGEVKVYGTFKNADLPVAGSVAANSAARDIPVQYRDPLRATGDQNNASGNWTNMSQTTIILGADGNTSVQAFLATLLSSSLSIPLTLLFRPRASLTVFH
uniref:Uncharacterized protein n=1 Tax=Hucho hucho TaxID=62062 RepID=A0A4W5MWH5_9TELE